MKIAALQAPLMPAGEMDVTALLGSHVERCSSLGVEILCCPEALFGGLADNLPDPRVIALTPEELTRRLAPIARSDVTLIVGFTEAAPDGRIFNTAAVLRGGERVGTYRKRHPAIRHSVYAAGEESPIFRVGGASFGIMICYDSTFPELAISLTRRGASMLFIPTFTALPLARDSDAVTRDAERCDVKCAQDNGVTIIRADVAGRTATHWTPGATAITGRDGMRIGSARALFSELVIAEIE